MYKHSFKFGDVCHFSFNGDSYPCMVVDTTPCTVKVLRMRSEDTNSIYGGETQFRLREKYYSESSRDRSAMVAVGGTWVLHHGYAHKWNLEF
jgi:hypothetical protein